MQKYIVDLNDSERKTLIEMTRGGRNRARKIKRAQILLMADEGHSDEEIANALPTGTSTVFRTRRKFVEGGLMPCDYKAYALGDEIYCILQVNRNVRPPQVFVFDGEFRPFPLEKISSSWTGWHLGNGTLPVDRDAMLDAIKELSVASCTGFVSVDMYDTSRGAVLGEFTPAPGAAFTWVIGNEGTFKFRQEALDELEGLYLKAEKEFGDTWESRRAEIRNVGEKVARVKRDVDNSAPKNMVHIPRDIKRLRQRASMGCAKACEELGHLMNRAGRKAEAGGWYELAILNGAQSGFIYEKLAELVGRNHIDNRVTRNEYLERAVDIYHRNLSNTWYQHRLENMCTCEKQPEKCQVHLYSIR